MVLWGLVGSGKNSTGINSFAWQQQGIVALAVARMGATWQQQQPQEQQQQQGPRQGQCDINNSGKSKGDEATTAARTMARETQQDEGNTATTMGYHSEGGGGVDSDGGDERDGSAAITTGYGGNDGSLWRKFGISLALTSGNKKST